jgi:hypothetical protein
MVERLGTDSASAEAHSRLQRNYAALIEQFEAAQEVGAAPAAAADR